MKGRNIPGQRRAMFAKEKFGKNFTLMIDDSEKGSPNPFSKRVEIPPRILPRNNPPKKHFFSKEWVGANRLR